MVGEIEAPGYLEGGDYFPAGRDLALVGIGLRSNFEACHQLMERDLLGTRRLAVVKDQFEQHQVRPRSRPVQDDSLRLSIAFIHTRPMIGCCVLQFCTEPPQEAAGLSPVSKMKDLSCLQVSRGQAVDSRQHVPLSPQDVCTCLFQCWGFLCRTACIWTAYSASWGTMCA